MIKQVRIEPVWEDGCFQHWEVLLQATDEKWHIYTVPTIADLAHYHEFTDIESGKIESHSKSRT